jgi:hypothetical protein
MSELIQIPEQLTQQLARRAVEIAQIIGPRKTGKGLNNLIPYYDTGIVGIDMPEETAYILDLENGIKAHAMVDLAGRVIPIRNPGGSISFRRASNKTIGKIPIITRLSNSGRLKSGEPEWYYPEKAALNFLHKSIKMSVDEWKRSARSQQVLDVLMKSDAKDDISNIFYGRPIS